MLPNPGICGRLKGSLPSRSLTTNAPEKLPKPNRKGSSSNHHFQGRAVKLRDGNHHLSQKTDSFHRAEVPPDCAANIRISVFGGPKWGGSTSLTLLQETHRRNIRDSSLKICFQQKHLQRFLGPSLFSWKFC